MLEYHWTRILTCTRKSTDDTRLIWHPCRITYAVGRVRSRRIRSVADAIYALATNNTGSMDTAIPPQRWRLVTTMVETLSMGWEWWFVARNLVVSAAGPTGTQSFSDRWRRATLRANTRCRHTGPTVSLDEIYRDYIIISLWYFQDVWHVTHFLKNIFFKAHA